MKACELIELSSFFIDVLSFKPGKLCPGVWILFPFFDPGPKSVRRTLVIGLIYGPRANKQFDIAFGVFWTLPGPLRHSDSLMFKPR